MSLTLVFSCLIHSLFNFYTLKGGKAWGWVWRCGGVEFMGGESMGIG
jgi:hypothetical protein